MVFTGDGGVAAFADGSSAVFVGCPASATSSAVSLAMLLVGAVVAAAWPAGVVRAAPGVVVPFVVAADGFGAAAVVVLAGAAGFCVVAWLVPVPPALRAVPANAAAD